jgi:type VI secretion system secreted protein VgrG
MTPKDGKQCTAIEPVDAAEAVEADNAEAGALSSASSRGPERGTQQYKTATTKPFKAPSPEESEGKKLSWIEIELVGEDDKPIAGEAYEITLPDGSVASGTLDAEGVARVEGFEPGTCKVCFPSLDKDAWEDA